MNLLIATTKKDIAFNRLKKEAIKKGFSVETIFYEETKSFPKTEFLKKIGYCILRDPYNTGKDFSKHIRYIRKFFNQDTLLDFNTFGNFPEYEDKLFQNKLVSKHKINMAKFYDITDINQLDTMEFPLIIKKKISSRGKGVFLAGTPKTAKEFLKNKEIKDYFIEQYIPLEQDYRLVIIGDRIIGSVLRKINIHGGDVRRIGVKVKSKTSPSEEIKNMALKIAKILQCDFAGIDIFAGKDKKIYFGECNMSPQFVSFEKNTKINVAGQLMEYIKKKTS